MKRLVKNISYTVIVNAISLIISLLTVLILPKIMGIEEYSFWQLYLFYSSYIVFLSIGWVDGVYLRMGGLNYDDLPRKVFVAQFWSMAFYLSIVTLIISLFVLNSSIEENKKFVLVATCICGLIYICRVYLQYVLQATNEIKVYIKIILLDRISFCTMIVFILLLGFDGFKSLIIIDLLIKFLTLIYAMLKCSKIVFGKFATFRENIKEINTNISVGIKLMFANLAGILIIGIVRFGIEQAWDIETFGKVSFTLTVNNMILVFISAIGVVIFPILCRLPNHILPIIYTNTRMILIIPLLGIMIFYQPVKLLLTAWLPQYSDALNYMALLVPIIIYESKMSLIITPYLNALRKEKVILFVNIGVVLLSLVTSITIIIFMHNLTLAVVSITFLLAVKCILAELTLSKILKINIKKDIVLESMMCILFISLNWYNPNWISMIIYLIVYLIYVAINKRSILESVNIIKRILKKDLTSFETY